MSLRSALGATLTAAALFCCSSTTIINRSEGTADGGTTEEDGGTAEQDGASTELACPTTGKATVAGNVAAADATEASGIVASAHNDGVYWIHNDSGDVARAFAVSSTGKLLATLSFDTTKPRDIEDMAIEDVSPEKSFLYFGDIGDNDEVRTELVIHRVEEPKLGGTTTLTATSEKMTVVYSDGAHNAETLLFDPTTKDLLIATKKIGGPSYIHRIGQFQAGEKVTTEKIAMVDVDTATGGDISRDGKYIAIRNYAKSAFLWVRAPGESLADALARTPCKVPVATETQGESFGFLVDNAGYVTVSEGSSPALNVTPLE